ncbi:hypothetical protein EVJ58_g3954 [Rhodofomes roseus]|uniref:Autophagy-related protein 13 n=1 Tax=Rhodofomes roseus TaxID=34475 RepID=A0A4Y9YL04_9APHY|nr:hypothetical protein EVJ58_g3954 [Rhodofomes roseus]
MSNETQKADQITYRFYTKLTLVVHHARATSEAPAEAKLDKWFNLETPDPEIFREQTRSYRSISTVQPVPGFQLQVLLCVPELASNQVLVYHAPNSSRLRIDPTPTHIVLESWDLSFHPEPLHARRSDDRSDITPPTIYKHGISLFRSIFTLLRILPAWKLARRRRTGGNRNGNFGIELRIVGQGQSRGDILGFDTPPAPGASPLAKEVHAFAPITHPTGSLSLSVTYLTAPHFELDALESLLSSRFLSDEGPDFTPTLAKNQQRDSLSTSPGSLPMRTSLPRSPPSASLADRFVVAPPISSRTTSFPTVGGSSPRMQSVALPSGSPRMQNVALPSVRRLSNAGMGTAGSASGLSDESSRQGAGSIRDDGPGVSALGVRYRVESFGGGRGTEYSSAQGPLPIRRQPMNPINPFKSSTLSSGSPSTHSPSPSLRQTSPLSSLPGGPSLPSRPAHTSPTSSRAGASAVPVAVKVSSSPVIPFRPSPPYAPSSLGDRRSLASAEGVAGGISESPGGTRKRYSSSFGHRYAATGGMGSEGSAGSGPREGERVAGASYLSANTDDDDISAFVQDIDARKPLQRLREQSESSPAESPVEPQSAAEPERPSDLLSRARTLSMPEPMLATEAAVDERLREMSDAFMSSLRGPRQSATCAGRHT